MQLTKTFDAGTVIKSLGLSILLYGWEIVFGLITGVDINYSHFHFALISNLLVVLLFAYIIRNSNFSGAKLSLLIWLVFFTSYGTIMIDTAMMIDFSDTITIDLLGGFISSLFFIPLLVFILGKWNPQESSVESEMIRHSFLGWFWRLVVGDISYFLIAAPAGIILFANVPGLAEFYEGKLPADEILFIVHLLIRVPLLMGAVVILINVLNTSRLSKAITAGATLSVLLGLSPLIRPTEFIPDAFRYGHLIEASSSLLIFGFVLGYLFLTGTKKGR